MKSLIYLPYWGCQGIRDVGLRDLSSTKYVPRERGDFWWHLYLIFAPLTDINEKPRLKGTYLNGTLRCGNQFRLHSGTLKSLFERHLKYSLVSPRNLCMFKKWQMVIHVGNKPYLWFTTTQTVEISTLNLFDLGFEIEWWMLSSCPS